MEQLTGNVFNIQRYTIHDGPGLRTELFLKGCPLRCKWCSNPESWRLHSEPGIYQSKCISKDLCGGCVDVCPEGDIFTFSEDEHKLTGIDRTKCSKCMKCYDECPSDAIKLWGKHMTVEECMDVIRRDKGYYDRSGGGVTVSGGDPLVQSDFVAALFKQCKEEGFQTCLESTFYSKWEEAEKILPYTDIIISDLKHMDTKVHRKWTGVHNERILENLKRITDDNREFILRIPVIPGINDDKKNIEASADFIVNELQGRIRVLQLLSFMRLGEEKYASLNMPYQMDFINLDRESFTAHVNEIADYFNSRGIHCVVGTKEKE